MTIGQTALLFARSSSESDFRCQGITSGSRTPGLSSRYAVSRREIKVEGLAGVKISLGSGTGGGSKIEPLFVRGS
jgi:hypothetical protein